MKPITLSYLVTLGLCLLATSGCGGGQDKWEKKRPKLYPASGTVLLEGAPLQDALVIYHAGDVAAQGRTDGDGKFTLTTFDDGDGAPEGSHKVTISKTESYYIPTKYDTPSEPSKALMQKQLLPKTVTQPDTTPFTAQVSPNDTNEATFDVKP